MTQESRSTDPLRIALVNDLIYPFSKGGVEKRVYDIARQLAGRGHEVHLIGTKDWDGPDEISYEGFFLSGVRSTMRTHSVGGRRSIWQAVVCAFSVSTRLARSRFDVVDVQSMAPLSCLMALLVARLKGMPVVVTWHEVWGDYWREYLGTLGFLGQLVERAIARLGGAHIAVSGETYRRVRELRVPEAELLPNGIDMTLIGAAEPGELSSDVVCVSRLVNHKNIDVLIDSIAILNGDGLFPTVFVIGNGPERERLGRHAREASVKNIHFLTEVATEAELTAILKASRVFALPSHREGFGLAALEASACGLPTVVVDHPDNATKEFVHPDLVVPSEPSALAEKIRALLEDEELWMKHSTYSRESAESHDLGWITNRLETMYRLLM